MEQPVVHPTNPQSEQDGELFAGRYRLRELLGAGGMGQVWLADQHGPQGFMRRVVIKRIHEHMAQQQEFVTRFEDEARLAGLLKHPNIVRVDDFGDHQGTLYLVMEHVEGTDLPALTERVGQLPLRIVLQIGVDIAKALAYAHELSDLEGKALKVVHRDVSPQNIMVTRNGQAKLLDFGIARATSNQIETTVGVVKGKLGYLSPEQVEGGQLDGRSDQFTLGIVLYELLSGGRLFDGKSDLAILTRIQKADAPHLGRLMTGLPEGLAEMIMRCLQRAKGRRFADCSDLARALEACLRQQGGRCEGLEFQRWWSGHEIMADDQTRMDDFGQLTEESPPGPEEPTVVTASGSIRAQKLDEREEPTQVADSGTIGRVFSQEQAADDDATNTALEEVATLRSFDSLPDPELGRAKRPLKDELPSHSKPPTKPTETHRSQEADQSLGGPVGTAILLVALALLGLFWFQVHGDTGDPSQQLVNQERAP